MIQTKNNEANLNKFLNALGGTDNEDHSPTSIPKKRRKTKTTIISEENKNNINPLDILNVLSELDENKENKENIDDQLSIDIKQSKDKDKEMSNDEEEKPYDANNSPTYTSGIVNNIVNNSLSQTPPPNNEINTITELNNVMKRMWHDKELKGISLKAISGETALWEEVNLDDSLFEDKKNHLYLKLQILLVN